MELRPKQLLAIQLLQESFRTGHRMPMLKAPTGFGKTVVAGKIIEMALAKGKKVAFIVDKLTLVDQASAHLDAVGIDHGVIQGNHWRTDYAKNVQVISAQTLARRKPWNFDLALIDEAHCMYAGVLDLAKDWDKIPFIGLSATPYTKGLGRHYDDLIIPVTISELIDDGFLVDCDAYGGSSADMKGCKTTAGDFNQRDAAERTNKKELIGDIVDNWKNLAGNRQTICFATDVAHSKSIANRFNQADITAYHIDAYTDSDDRRMAIKEFKENKIKVLTSVGVLHTGFDAPNAEVAILARPTKSLSLHHQMIGRILRINEGKGKGLILDHAGNIERLGFHTDATPEVLDNGEKGESSNSSKEKDEDDLPKACPQCKSLKPAGASKCPMCGFMHIRKTEVVEAHAELKQLKKANRDTTPAEKMSFYGGLKKYASEKGFKSGWASHKFREKFGVWPNHYKDAPLVQPNPDVLGFITHCAIKRSHAR